MRHVIMYPGIDVALKKPQYVAILAEDSGVLSVHKVAFQGASEFTQDNDGLRRLANYLEAECPGVPVAIDAPSSPLRECNGGHKCGRECERVLNADDMHAYYTPCRKFFEEWSLQCPHGKHKKNKPRWMEVGFRLWNTLADRRLIEVFPHATFCLMLRAIDPAEPLYPKTPGSSYAPQGKKRPTPDQTRAIQAAALEQRKRLIIAYGIDLKEYAHSNSFDEIDAVAAAYTNYLCCNGKTEALGSAEEGQIIVPVLEAPANHRYVQPRLGDYGYDSVLPQASRATNAPKASRQQSAPNAIIRVRYRDGNKEDRLPTPEETEAITNCDVLKNPGKADIVYCCVCNTMRVVNPQDFFQVKRCEACQSRRR